MAGHRTACALALTALAGCAQAPVTSNNAPAQDPDRLAEVYVQMGVEYMREGQNEIALNRLQKALQHDPGYPAAHTTLGILYARLGERDKAERHFREAVRLAPEDSAALNNYGQFLCARGRHKEGLELFARAVANPLYRTPEVAHTNAGMCALGLGDEKSAEQHFRAALRAAPKFAPALLQMARLSLRNGEHLSARGYLQRYAEVAEHTAASLWLGVQIERALGDLDTAASYALALKSRFPDAEETRLLLQSGD